MSDLVAPKQCTRLRVLDSIKDASAAVVMQGGASKSADVDSKNPIPATLTSEKITAQTQWSPIRHIPPLHRMTLS